MKFRKYILEISVFICGAVVMIFELVGSRILGPYFGTSIFVWTSLIGIILGSLSLGYYLGGKIADKNPSYNNLSLIIFLSGIFIGLLFFFKDFLLFFFQSQIADIRLSSVIASIILFAPTSILLGMVSPYAVKLKLVKLEESGVTIGNLYAISTAGSIFGTFFSGFYLIPEFGTNRILLILAIVLAALSLFLIKKDFLKLKILALLVMAVSWSPAIVDGRIAAKGFVDVDTEYNRIWIYEQLDQKTQKPVRILLINNEKHSGMFLDEDGLVFNYLQYYGLAEHFNPGFQTTLMLGGAGYSYPKEFLKRYPSATMDVIEIDPKITELAKQYFNLPDNPRLSIYHQDARVYLNQTTKKYDVIYGDAFNSHYSVPYQLTTQEAIQRKYKILNDQGVVILNLISAITGDKAKFLRAEYFTFKSVFPQVYLFRVDNTRPSDQPQNVILLAIKSDQPANFTSANDELNDYLDHLWQQEIIGDERLLTDDWAPVEYYMNQAI